MEDSMTSCSSDTEQISSWDFYFQDFMGNPREEEEPTLLFNTKASSVIAFADKNANRNSDWMVSCVSKPRKRKLHVDHDLDDTATSPVHRRKEEKADVASGETREERDYNLQFAEKNSSNKYTELRKKGLCLVPVSLFLEELPYLKY